jgi:hypothetical protein
MISLRDFFFRLTHATPERRASRRHLKLAKTGDTEAYLALSSNYLDLALVYFGGCLHEDLDLRLARVEDVFKAVWQHLPFAARLSDFEYMLANALVQSIPASATILSPEALVTKLRLLSPNNRFALITYEFENWPLRWVALVMRHRPRAVHRLLSEARCELCGVSWESLSEEERGCLEAISISMDLSPNLQMNKTLGMRLKAYPRVRRIKALWLELRPQLVEIRHRYLLETNDREKLLANILKASQSVSINQPRLVDRVVNRVHFKRHGEIRAS